MGRHGDAAKPLLLRNQATNIQQELFEPDGFFRRVAVSPHRRVCLLLPASCLLDGFIYFGAVTPGHVSVRKGEAGRPSLL